MLHFPGEGVGPTNTLESLNNSGRVSQANATTKRSSASIFSLNHLISLLLCHWLLFQVARVSSLRIFFLVPSEEPRPKPGPSSSGVVFLFLPAISTDVGAPLALVEPVSLFAEGSSSDWRGTVFLLSAELGNKSVVTL